MTRGRLTLRLSAAAALLALLSAPLLANGGTVRISRAPVGPYFVTVYSSPTPLRTGEVDISVLVQDSADSVVEDAPIEVEAHPVGAVGMSADPIRRGATRQQATNKLFRAAKFDVEVEGEWEFRIHVGGDEGGTVAFRATLTEPSLLDRPYLLGALILIPLLLVGWLVGRGDDGDEEIAAA